MTFCTFKRCFPYFCNDLSHPQRYNLNLWIIILVFSLDLMPYMQITSLMCPEMWTLDKLKGRQSQCKNAKCMFDMQKIKMFIWGTHIFIVASMRCYTVHLALPLNALCTLLILKMNYYVTIWIIWLYYPVLCQSIHVHYDCKREHSWVSEMTSDMGFSPTVIKMEHTDNQSHWLC